MKTNKTQKTKLKIGESEKEIFYRGNFDKNFLKKSIAIVGSRRMTRYGREVVDKFISAFIAQGVTTISGFMYGVDTEVHQKTIDYGGKTIAVFGCGLNVIYPPENKKLYDEIIESGGSIVSEYDDNAKPHLWKFPQRNKIVAGMASLGVLVVEAGLNSGSLVTANLAIKMGKKVYAVPGPISSSVSAGCNEIIRTGLAEMVTDPYQILKTKNIKEKIQIQNHKPENILEQKIYKLLENEALNLDEIAAMTGESIVEIGKTLSLMSIKNLVTESGGKYYLNSH